MKSLHRKLLILTVLANIPVALVLLFLITGKTKFSTQVSVNGKEKVFYSNKPLVEQHYDRYVQLADMEKPEFLTKVYDDLRYTEEGSLSPHLRDFVIKVKVSQFGK